MGSAWKDLPEELSEPARHLAQELRAIKDAAGLSLSELASRTHYSRASWERWLNGKRVVTEQALEALIGTVDCDGAALRALRERAVTAPGGPADPSAKESPVGEQPLGEASEPGEPAADGPSDAEAGAEPAAALPAGQAAAPAVAWWRRPAVLVSGAAVLAVLLVLAGLRATTRHGGQPSAAPEPPPTASPATTSAKPVPATPTCQAIGCDHKDPKSTGCGKDARTLHTDVIGKVVIYLRYSQKCQAAWAAITEGEPGDYATIINSAGDSEQGLIHYGYDNYSSMLNAADPSVGFRVCGHQPAGDLCTTEVSDLASVVASTPIPIGPASPPPGTGAGAATGSPVPTETPAPTPTAPTAPS
ncbi:DUF2690 domain-containing protein [Kitasatospora xanthocidica]|uniref:helix-turn-helix domain-containing protein n=1 Tax=Kitasatospora xanthocidica TaxID=83382 RepID=UPI0036F10536